MPSQLLLTFTILLLAIALLLTERLRADLVALLVVVALGITGVLTPREAFSGFASSAVVTIVAIFVLAEALRITGMTERAGGLLLRVAGTADQTMAGAAVATVVAPIAIQAARQAGFDPRSLAMGVALATSLAFLTPLGHPVNVLVMGPGGYRFRDYLKVGWPLTLLLGGLIMLLLPIFWLLAAR